MSQGKVEEYFPERGFGSIIDDETGMKLTVYANYINLKDGQMLTAGQAVEYEIDAKRHDNWAVNVRMPGPENVPESI